MCWILCPDFPCIMFNLQNNPAWKGVCVILVLQMRTLRFRGSKGCWVNAHLGLNFQSESKPELAALCPHVIPEGQNQCTETVKQGQTLICSSFLLVPSLPSASVFMFLLLILHFHFSLISIPPPKLPPFPFSSTFD